MESCLLLNISQCDVTENHSQFVVTLYNPLSQNVTIPIRIPVTGLSYIVRDPKGKKIVTDMVPIPTPVLKIPGRTSKAKYELVFIAEDMQPLAFRSYFIKKSNHIDRPKKLRSSVPKDIVMGSDVSILIFPLSLYTVFG